MTIRLIVSIIYYLNCIRRDQDATYNLGHTAIGKIGFLVICQTNNYIKCCNGIAEAADIWRRVIHYT